MMETTGDKASYLHRKTAQLQQWERVMDKLIARAADDKDSSNTELRHHIVKIRVKKARLEANLRQLQETENGNWDDIKAGLEINWVELREAFLKASAKPK
jgi:hypothetical protein